MFRHLAVCVGGCTLEAAEAICHTAENSSTGAEQRLEVLEGIVSLVDKSLLQQEAIHGEPRFRMLETIRAYGLECLTANGEARATWSAYAAYCLRLVEMRGHNRPPGWTVWRQSTIICGTRYVGRKSMTKQNWGCAWRGRSVNSGSCVGT